MQQCSNRPQTADRLNDLHWNIFGLTIINSFCINPFLNNCVFVLRQINKLEAPLPPTTQVQSIYITHILFCFLLAFIFRHQHNSHTNHKSIMSVNLKFYSSTNVSMTIQFKYATFILFLLFF